MNTKPTNIQNPNGLAPYADSTPMERSPSLTRAVLFADCCSFVALQNGQLTIEADGPGTPIAHGLQRLSMRVNAAIHLVDPEEAGQETWQKIAMLVEKYLDPQLSRTRLPTPSLIKSVLTTNRAIRVKPLQRRGIGHPWRCGTVYVECGLVRRSRNASLLIELDQLIDTHAVQSWGMTPIVSAIDDLNQRLEQGGEFVDHDGNVKKLTHNDLNLVANTIESFAPGRLMVVESQFLRPAQ